MDDNQLMSELWGSTLDVHISEELLLCTWTMSTWKRYDIATFVYDWYPYKPCVSWKRFPKLPVYFGIYRYGWFKDCTLKESFSWHQVCFRITMDYQVVVQGGTLLLRRPLCRSAGFSGWACAATCGWCCPPVRAPSDNQTHQTHKFCNGVMIHMKAQS